MVLAISLGKYSRIDSEMIYPEHDDAYLIECLDNLSKKNAELTNGMSISKMKMQIAIETGL